MFYKIGERFLTSTWAEVALFFVSMFLMFLLFGVSSFDPSSALLRCRGVSVPPSVNLVQSEGFCRCMKSSSTFGTPQEKTDYCLEQLENHKNATRQLIKVS